MVRAFLGTTSGSALQTSSNELSSQSVSHFSNIHISHMARLQDTPPSNVSRVHVHAIVQIQRGALPREKVRSLVAQRSPQDGSGQGSTVPHSHATSTSAHGCRCLAPRPSLAGARITQYLGKGLGQTRANGMVSRGEIPGGEIPGGGDPGEESTGGQSPGASHRGQSGIESEQGGGGGAGKLFSGAPFSPTRRSEHRAHTQELVDGRGERASILLRRQRSHRNQRRIKDVTLARAPKVGACSGRHTRGKAP